MKKIYKILSLVSMLALFSCTPEIAQDETLNKRHDDPHRAEYLLYEGDIYNDEYLFEENSNSSDLKYLSTRQKIVFVNKGGKWEIEQGSSKEFRVMSIDKGDKIGVYALIIRYYNKQGEDITKEFIQDGQDQIHQHFFMLDEVKPTFDGTAQKSDTIHEEKTNPTTGQKINKSLIDVIQENFFYQYCDTDPYDKSVKRDGAKMNGDKNPIGFKGYFKFYKERKEMTIRIPLMHARLSKYKNDKASPYYMPTPAQRNSEHWDIEVKIPVRVYASISELASFNNAQMTEDFNSLNHAAKKFVTSVSKAFNISIDEALTEINKKRFRDKTPSNSGLSF